MLVHLCLYCLHHAEDELILGGDPKQQTMCCHVDSSWSNDPATQRRGLDT